MHTPSVRASISEVLLCSPQLLALGALVGLAQLGQLVLSGGMGAGRGLMGLWLRHCQWRLRLNLGMLIWVDGPVEIREVGMSGGLEMGVGDGTDPEIQGRGAVRMVGRAILSLGGWSRSFKIWVWARGWRTVQSRGVGVRLGSGTRALGMKLLKLTLIVTSWALRRDRSLQNG